MRNEQLTDPKASNWVDRNQGPEPELTRVLQLYIGPYATMTLVRLREHVLAIRALAEGEGGEGRVTSYLGEIDREVGLAEAPVRTRTTAAALWHIVKCAEVRDRARRLLDDATRPAR